jgi:hypothetical protein
MHVVDSVLTATAAVLGILMLRKIQQAEDGIDAKAEARGS